MRRPVCAVLIEDKANGPAIIQRLKDNVTDVAAISPQGGKFARMFVPPEWQVGDWYVGRYAAWTEPFIGQITTFPNATHDMAERLKGNPVGYWLYKEKGYLQLSSSRDILTLSDGCVTRSISGSQGAPERN